MDTQHVHSQQQDRDLDHPNASDDEVEEEEELDEVMGYHFVNCTTLFVAYIYVNSGTQ